MDPHLDQVALGFSRKAQIYDAFGSGHPNLTRMRHKVYAHVLGYLRPGERMLELNAGTGADAAFFASQGFAVHATDLSEGMVAAIAEKAQRLTPDGGPAGHPGQPGPLTFQQCSFTHLDEIRQGPFDYIYSNFGGLNCIPDLASVAGDLPAVLSPGGRLTWVIMPPIAPWELALVLKGQTGQAFRRLHRGGIRAHVEGARFQVNYYTPRQVMQALGKDFRLVRVEGLSIFTPPADRKDFALRHPKLYALLCGVDDRIANLPPFNQWGDFFILTAEYLPQ